MCACVRADAARTWIGGMDVWYMQHCCQTCSDVPARHRSACGRPLHALPSERAAGAGPRSSQATWHTSHNLGLADDAASARSMHQQFGPPWCWPGSLPALPARLTCSGGRYWRMPGGGLLMPGMAVAASMRRSTSSCTWGAAVGGAAQMLALLRAHAHSMQRSLLALHTASSSSDGTAQQTVSSCTIRALLCLAITSYATYPAAAPAAAACPHTCRWVSTSLTSSPSTASCHMSPPGATVPRITMPCTAAAEPDCQGASSITQASLS